MPTRQDQLHSYQFAVQRVVAALVMRETDPAQSPFRRAAGATLASVLIAAISLGAVAIYGVIVGGGSSKWQTTGAVIVEQESGARFVYLKGKLHPVVNQTSALLIVGSSGKPVKVSRKSIAGKPRGVRLGIPDAPDPLPVKSALDSGPWTLCSAAASGAGTGPRSTLLVGAAPQGGDALGDEGVLVRRPDGEVHLLWNGRRHLVRDAAVVLSALGWATQPVVPVAPALLNSMPAGADLKLIDIPGRGQRFDDIQGARIGEVFVVEGQGQGGDQYAVAMRGGLAAITEVQLQLLLADPETGEKIGQREPTPLSLSEFAAIPKLDDLAPAGAAPPATVPAIATADSGAMCASVRDDTAAAEVRVRAQAPDVETAMATGERSAAGAVLADYVRIEPGRGAVVEAVAAPGTTGGTLSVVTDLGRRYAVPGAEVLAKLGFEGVRPVRLPASIVALLPEGPALDPEAADDPVDAS